MCLCPSGRIGRGSLAEEVEAVGVRMEKAEQSLAEDEDIAEDAPDEFLDPLMAHLMTDPVILPASRVRLGSLSVILGYCSSSCIFL